MSTGKEHRVQGLVSDQQSVGSSPTCYVTLGRYTELSALLAMLRIDVTQGYIHMACKRANPVSAPGVGGNGLGRKKNLHKKKYKKITTFS